MVYSGQIGQVQYRDNLVRALPGLLEGMGPYKALNYMNTAGGVAAVYTVTPPASPDNDQLYTLLINGIQVSFTTDASATQLELGTGLFDAIRANGEVSRLFDSAIDGSGVITLTHRFLGVTATVVQGNPGDTTADLVIANPTAAALGGSIPYGVFVATTTTTISDPVLQTSQAVLPSNGADIPVGVTMSAFTQKEGLAEAASVGYVFRDQMNVMVNTRQIEGIWTRVVQADFDPATDTPYVDIVAPNRGYLTNVAGGNIDVSAWVTAESTVQTGYNGESLILLNLNGPA